MLPVQLNGIKEIPDEILDSVKECVQNTFESISGDRPDFVMQNGNEKPMNGIIGSINVFNTEHTLSMMIAIPKKTALAVSEVFCGMELPFESDDMGDLVGEISNILAGDVAASVEKIGFVGQSSLPTATRGSDLTLFLPNKPPTAKLKFVGTGGEFWVNLALSESRRHK
ncbi:chemotaxis protein CheX [Balneolaceae bacterium ANBcel3]|nr:chemotaxis protein CheX [Balneolaceae bacterium ANBcel3]